MEEIATLRAKKNEEKEKRPILAAFHKSHGFPFCIIYTKTLKMIN